MNLKIRPTMLLAFFTASVFSGSAVTAKDGTITFSGQISDATCDITGGDGTNANQGPDFKVTLPPVGATALKEKGQFAGDTPFYINLSGTKCPDGKIANVIFERAQSMNIDSTTGYLKNHTVTGAAKNVQVRILSKDKKALDLNKLNASHQPVTIKNNTGRFEYWGQYAATGQATAGTVETNVVYSISYN